MITLDHDKQTESHSEPKWTAATALRRRGTEGKGYFWQSSFCQSLLDPKAVCLHRVQGRGQPPSQLQCLSKHIVKIIIKWQAIKVCPQALEESKKLLLTAIRRNPNDAAFKKARLWKDSDKTTLLVRLSRHCSVTQTLTFYREISQPLCRRHEFVLLVQHP